MKSVLETLLLKTWVAHIPIQKFSRTLPGAHHSRLLLWSPELRLCQTLTQASRKQKLFFFFFQRQHYLIPRCCNYHNEFWEDMNTSSDS